MQKPVSLEVSHVCDPVETILIPPWGFWTYVDVCYLWRMTDSELFLSLSTKLATSAMASFPRWEKCRICRSCCAITDWSDRESRAKMDSPSASTLTLHEHGYGKEQKPKSMRREHTRRRIDTKGEGVARFLCSVQESVRDRTLSGF